MRYKLSLFLLIFIAPVYAQENASSSELLQRIVERLDRLEEQNRALVQEITALRQEVAAAHAPGPVEGKANTNQEALSLDERVSVNEARTAEQAQTKVEAAHKSPLQLTGLVLFNAFTNSEGRNSTAVVASNLLADSYGSGATVRQTLLGFNFQGPQIAGGGRVDGSLLMDFWGGSSQPGSNWFRLRQASISLDWANRTFTIGQDKPLISPYQPESLAEVGIPPLSGAGNLWYWLPQARYEERLRLGPTSGVKAQIALLQSGGTAYLTAKQAYNYTAPLKPALEGRVAFWHRFDDKRRIEIAPGFHVSSIQFAGTPVDSRIGSLDWLITPASHVSITGTIFTGQNVAGLGSLGNGIAAAPNGLLRAVHTSGGWTQFAFPITDRLTLNVFGGLENDEAANLSAPTIVRNWSYAANVIYHLNSSFMVGLEGLQMRTRSASGVTGDQNRYDLAFGYLF